MCGIIGLFAKNEEVKRQLGALMECMLVTMSDRGPDSAGFAVYSEAVEGREKLTLQSSDPVADFTNLIEDLLASGAQVFGIRILGTHAILSIQQGVSDNVIEVLDRIRPQTRTMSRGASIEIFKEVGNPAAVCARFSLNSMSGTHGIGHTRMATESEVTTLGAHPFSTGEDHCMVHNGSMSNHNNLRRELRRSGIRIETENDTEVAAAYLSFQLARGRNLRDALDQALKDLDGFYTFVVGTQTGFGVLRDPIACKPAVMAETEDYVAFGSEYRALVDLPGIEMAKIWEPEPATVYFWDHSV